jgi:hypothetical protein
MALRLVELFLGLILLVPGIILFRKSIANFKPDSLGYPEILIVSIALILAGITAVFCAFYIGDYPLQLDSH